MKSLAPYGLKSRLLAEVRERLKPWIHDDGICRLVPGMRGLTAPPEVSTWDYPLPASWLQAEAGQEVPWGSLGMKPVEYPNLGFVLEGEADLRIGFPARGGGGSEGYDQPPSCHVVSLPARHALFYPPHTMKEHRVAHWWRPRAESAMSKILWLAITPHGSWCHICVTKGHDHPKQPCAFLPDSRHAVLAELLWDELTMRAPGYEMAAQHHLLALLTRVQRGLLPAALPLASNEIRLDLPDYRLKEVVQATIQPEMPVSGRRGLQRAIDFIQMNLANHLTPQLVSEHVFVSQTQLNRLFRAETGMPLMRYITKCRMAAAQDLLASTDLSINEISRLSGYRHCANFTRAFTEWVSFPPLAYRRAQAQAAVDRDIRRGK